MPHWSLRHLVRHLVEAAIPGTENPWGVTPFQAVLEIAQGARAATGLTIVRATDFCTSLDIRFRQSLLPAATNDACRSEGLILYGNDLRSDERELVLLHGVAHRLIPPRFRPLEFFAWLLALELAVPRDLVTYLGFDRFVEHHSHLPLWAIAFVASLYEIRMPLHSDHYKVDEPCPDSATTSSKGES